MKSKRLHTHSTHNKFQALNVKKKSKNLKMGSRKIKPSKEVQIFGFPQSTEYPR